MNRAIKKKLQKEEILAYLKELKPKLEKDGIVKLGLFGSYANDKAHNKSDIDITIETNKKFAKKFYGFSAFAYYEKNIREKISNHFGLNVDIYKTSSTLTSELISKQQKILKGVIYV